MYMAWRSTVVHPVFSLLASVLLKMKGNALKLKKKNVTVPIFHVAFLLWSTQVTTMIHVVP